VPNKTKQLLEEINEVSRQLLSRILTVQKNSQINTTAANESDNNEANTSSSITDKELTGLMSTRDKLIHSLFEKEAITEIAQELTLLNEAVSLDGELLSQSQTCKKTLAEQVIRLKKSKKVTKSYQQY